MVEEQGNEATEEQVTESTEEVQTPGAEATEPHQGEEAVPVETAYEPDYGYRVNHEDKEFDDWAKSVLKAEGLGTKEIEESLRGLYAKAGGFDSKKEENSNLRDQLGTETTGHASLKGEVQELLYYMDNDLGTFFKQLGLDRQKVYDYVQASIDEEKLDPTQRARLQSTRQTLVNSYQADREVERLRAENTQLSQSSFDTELDRALTGRESQDFQKKFDDLYGQGAFREEVTNAGKLYYQANGHDTTPLDAALSTMKKHRSAVERLAGAGNDLETARKAQAAGKPGGHIPNVGGGSIGASPTKARPKTFEDFNKQIASRLEEIQG